MNKKIDLWWFRPVAYSMYFGLGLTCLCYSALTWHTATDPFIPLISLFAGLFFIVDSVRKGTR